MNLMRNSGFEVGDTSYWTNDGFATFIVSNASPHYGVYSAILNTSADAYQYIRNDDLIEVNAGDAVLLSTYFMGLVAGHFTQRIRCYTIDGEDIGYVSGSRHEGTNAYKVYDDVVIVPTKASYVSYELACVNSGAGVDVYLDVCAMQVNPEYNPPISKLVLSNLEAITADGSTRGVFKMLHFAIDYYAYLSFDANAGHTADCTVIVQEKDIQGIWHTVGTFAVTAIDANEKIALTDATGRCMAIDYSFGAGVKDCDILVTIIGKR